MPVKICTQCKKELPATEKYFYKDKKGKYGLRSVCKKCKCKGAKYEYPEEIPDGFIKCSKCNEVLQANKENFCLKKGGRYGFSKRCKECDKEYRTENKEKLDNDKKNYYLENAERLKKYQKSYKEENKEQVSKRKKKYYIKNKAEINLKLRNYYKENKTMYRQKSREYGKTEKGKRIRQLTSQRYYSRKKQNVVDLTVSEWEECLIFFDYKDAYTGKKMNIVSQDHIIPQSKSGPYSKWNVIPCERSINSSKSNSDMEEWYRKQRFFDEKRLEKIKRWIARSLKYGYNGWIDYFELKKIRKANKKEGDKV